MCSDMIPEDFDRLVQQIARIEMGWLKAPSAWPERGKPLKELD